MNDCLLWPARAVIGERFAATAHAVTTAVLAQHFSVSLADAESLLRALHALLLEPGTTRIRMANPISANETPYSVLVAGQTYWANCAWDTFGIAAAPGLGIVKTVVSQSPVAQLSRAQRCRGGGYLSPGGADVGVLASSRSS